MKVYTFSTGGCRDGIYLESLSKTKEGVFNLIKEYESFSEREYIKFTIDEEEQEITVYYTSYGSEYSDVYDIVSFSVI